MRPGALFLLLVIAAIGQTAATFEVASIKPATAAPGAGSGVHTEKGRLEGRNVTVKRCMRGAYGVPEAQIFGGPKWVDEERYDIDAKAAGPAGDGEMMGMLQALLADRFKLVFHRETRPLAGYALVVAKTGLTAKPAAPDSPSRTNSSRTAIDAQSCTMAQLAVKLSEALHLPVADATGISGAYDFHLEWIPEDVQARAPSKSGNSPVAAAPDLSIFAVLHEKLGLKLEARKVPTEVLVIDSVEKASEN